MGVKSETPVTFLLGWSHAFTSLAPTGSVTALNTIFAFRADATAAWAEGVAIATITSGLSPANFFAIWLAVAVAPCALLLVRLKLLLWKPEFSFCN